MMNLSFLFELILFHTHRVDHKSDSAVHYRVKKRAALKLLCSFATTFRQRLVHTAS